MFRSIFHKSCSSDLSSQYPRHHLSAASPPLLDRCEIIQLSVYTLDEKLLHIALRFLLPRQVTQNELSEAHVKLTVHALLQTVGPRTTCKKQDYVR